MKQKQETGITLIALVITIIVLLILAGVSIATLTGENGVLTKASKASEKQAHAEIEEAMSLLYNEYQMEISTAKVASIESIKVAEVTKDTTFWEYLLEKQYIDADGVIDTEKLVGSKTKYGNGTKADGDVYILEEKNMNYEVNYYDSKNEASNIWKIDSNSDTLSDPSIFEYEVNADGKTITITGIKENYIKENEYPYPEVSEEEKTEGWVHQKYYKKVFYQNKEMKKIKIPTEIDGLTVTKLGWNTSVLGCGYLTQIILPNSLESIESYAFDNFHSLKEITIPASVKNISEEAFYDSCVEKIIIEKGSPLDKNLALDCRTNYLNTHYPITIVFQD